jgi:hypothetical protein
MNYLNKTLLVLITAFQVSAMAETTELQRIIERLSNPDGPMRILRVNPLESAENTRKDELLNEFVRTLKNLNDISVEIFNEELSSDFIGAIKTTIKKIITKSYKSSEDKKNSYLKLLEQEIFDTIHKNNFYDVFMYFQLWFRTDGSTSSYIDTPEKIEFTTNQGILFKHIYKYYLLVHTGVTEESFWSYIRSTKLNDSDLVTEELVEEMDKIVGHVRGKISKALNPLLDSTEK